MEQYKFLLKPVFYVFSLLFATWLVIKIEKISPSDFGDTSVDIIQSAPPEIFRDNKKYLQNVCIAFKAGALDTVELNKKLIYFLESTKNSSSK